MFLIFKRSLSARFIAAKFFLIAPLRLINGEAILFFD